MEPILVILRGNSGSGKTTAAKQLRERLGNNTMLISQDVIRREILKVKDDPGNPAIQLIKDMVLYGNKIGYNVILEGIFSKKKYGSMLMDLISEFQGKTFVFYFDITFDETLKRHGTKPNTHEFGEKEMREWWKEKDFLGLKEEMSITNEMSPEQTHVFIHKSVRNYL